MTNREKWASHFKGYSERSESLRCAKMGDDFAQGIADAFKKENALKLIDSLETTNGALRRSIIMSDAIMSIGKET